MTTEGESIAKPLLGGLLVAGVTFVLVNARREAAEAYTAADDEEATAALEAEIMRRVEAMRADNPAPSYSDEWTSASRATFRTDNPPSWVADERTWDRAKANVRPYWHTYRDPWAVVAHVYEQMGGERQ